MNIEVNVSGVDLNSVIDHDGYYGDEKITLGQSVAAEIARQMRADDSVRTQLIELVRAKATPVVKERIKELMTEDGGLVNQLLLAHLEAALVPMIRTAIECEVGAAVITYIQERVESGGNEGLKSK